MHKREFDILKEHFAKICESGGFNNLKITPYLSDERNKFSTTNFERVFAKDINGELNPMHSDSHSNLVDGDDYVDIIDDYGHMHNFKIDVKVAENPRYDTAGIGPESLNSFSGGYYCLFNAEKTHFKLISRDNLYKCLVDGSKESYLDKGVSSDNLNSDYIKYRINYEYFYI